MEALPDFASLSDADLDRLLRDVERAEDDISVRRRFLHGRIDIYRGERVDRLRGMVETGTLELHSPETLERPLFDGTGEVPDAQGVEPMPELSTLSDDELRDTIHELEREEDDISLRRRVLHGHIDILRAERERRRRGGAHVDPADLGPILGGSAP